MVSDPVFHRRVTIFEELCYCQSQFVLYLLMTYTGAMPHCKKKTDIFFTRQPQDNLKSHLFHFTFSVCACWLFPF